MFVFYGFRGMFDTMKCEHFLLYHIFGTILGNKVDPYKQYQRMDFLHNFEKSKHFTFYHINEDNINIMKLS